jgi:hypothetical protein
MELYIFCNMAPYEGEWLASCPNYLILMDLAFNAEWLGSSIDPMIYAEKIKCLLFEEANIDSLVTQPVSHSV